MATRAFGIDFATLTASVIVIVACCDRVVLLGSKNTIQAFDGGGGAGGGSRKDMFCVDSPHAVTRRASPNRAERLLSILSSKGLLCSLHRNATQLTLSRPATWALRSSACRAASGARLVACVTVEGLIPVWHHDPIEAPYRPGV